MEISNKTLAWLVIAAIVVSIFGTTLSLQKLSRGSLASGYAVTSNATGTAAVDISQSVVLRYTVSSVDFGAGSVNSSGGFNNCTLSINGSSTTIHRVGCEGFNSTNTGGTFSIENAGTSFLNVTLNFSKNATSFLGGNHSLARLRYTMSNNEAGSCEGTLSNQTWTEVIENASINVCSNLSWIDTKDTLYIGINISIPNNARSGSSTVNVIAQGTQI